MPLTKIKLADAIERVECPNTDLQYGVLDVRGVNNSKKFIRTKANISNRDLSKFQIVFPHCFVFNHRTSRNGSKFSIAYNDTESAVICTEDYVVFRVKETYADIVAPEWLYLYFNRSEFDRYVITNSWGSSTEFYNWEDICALEMDLPPLPIQKKYIAIYHAILNELKMNVQITAQMQRTCSTFVEDVLKTVHKVPISTYIEEIDQRNSKGTLGLNSVKGITTRKEFISTKADMNGVSLSNYKVVQPKEFAYVADTSRRGDKISLAFNEGQEPILVSSITTVFRVKDGCQNTILPEYMYLFLRRNEFDRYARYNSWGSARETISWDDFGRYQIPVVPLKQQQSIINLFHAQRKQDLSAQKLTEIQNKISPILIAGALKEGAKS